MVELGATKRGNPQLHVITTIDITIHRHHHLHTSSPTHHLLTNTTNTRLSQNRCVITDPHAQPLCKEA